MAYTIIKTNGTVLTTIADGTVDTTSSSLDLPGRNYAAYGVIMDTNMVHLMENFANSSVPSNPIKGQLWYNTATQVLYVCPTDGETNANNWFKLLTSNDATTTFNNLTVIGTLSTGSASITNLLNANDVVANTISVSANADLLGSTVASDLTSNSITAGNALATLAGDWNATGNVSINKIKSSNYCYANGNPIPILGASGSNHQVQYNVNGNLTATPSFEYNPDTSVLSIFGNVNAVQFVGNGVSITDINAGNLTGTIASGVQGNITSLGTLSALTVSGTATVGNISSSVNVNDANLLGVIRTSTQPNITSLGSLIGLTSNGTIDFLQSSNVSLGAVSNLHILGGDLNNVLTTDGFGNLSWVPQGSLSITAAGSNTQIQYNNGGNLAGSSDFTYNNSTKVLSVSGNIVAGNANLGNAVTANFFNGSGYNLANIRGANILGQAPNAIVAGTVYTAAQPNITSVGTLTSLTSTGNINSGGNVQAVYFIGDGSALSNVTAITSVTAGTVITNAQPNITSVGTLSSLVVSGNINSSNATLGNSVTANFFVGSGANLTNINGSNVSLVPNATHAISATSATSATTAGTVTTAAQPNITSVGSLTSLTVTGNISSGNASLGNAATAAYFLGNGFYLTNITGSNVTGTVASATVAASANSVAGANVTGTVANATYATSAGSATTATTATTAGTVTTNAQPNITSVGTLTSLNTTGSITSTALNAGLELGSSSQINTPYVDFHSSGNPNDYDVRLIASGGTTLGTGILNIYASQVNRNSNKLFDASNFQITTGTVNTYSYTNIVGGFSDAANYFDVFPPAGYTMSNLMAFIPSIAYIYFAGGVNADDALRCIWYNLGDRIRVYVQNTEQRANPGANYLAVWSK